MNFEKKYLEFLQVHNLCSICLVFVVLTDVFVSQAFERNGRVSVTVMDGEEMVGRMANQVLITLLRVVDAWNPGRRAFIICLICFLCFLDWMTDVVRHV